MSLVVAKNCGMAKGKFNVEQLRMELIESLDYEETCDRAKANRVVTLTKQLLLVRHDSASHGGSSFSNSPEKLQRLQEDARIWLRANPVGAGGTNGGPGGGGSRTRYHQPSCYFRG